MRKPKGTYLEFGFYLPDCLDADALIYLIQACLRQGATFTGHLTIYRGPGARSKPFASTTDFEFLEELVVNIPDLFRLLYSPDIKVIQVYLKNVIRTRPRVAEIITYHDISKRASLVDHHPLAVWAEGSAFDGTLPTINRARTLKVGLRAYKSFVSLVQSLSPAYASITSEIGLDCPSDLLQDPRSYAFSDFYISESYIGSSALEKICKLYADSYIQRLANGIYISTYEFLNPDHLSIDSAKIAWLSIEVAKLIGERAKHRS
jgi:hypothetical protein